MKAGFVFLASRTKSVVVEPCWPASALHLHVVPALREGIDPIIDDLPDGIAYLAGAATTFSWYVWRRFLREQKGEKEVSDDARHYHECSDRQSHVTGKNPPCVIASNCQPEPSVHLTLA